MGGFSVEEMCKSPNIIGKEGFCPSLGVFRLTGPVAVEKFTALFGGKTGEVIHRLLWIFVGKFTFPQACGELIPSVHRCPQMSTAPKCREKGLFCRKTGIFGILYKSENPNLCKTHFFHTVFHNLWKSHGKIHREAVKAVENLWRNPTFSTGGEGDLSVSFP